MGFFEDLRDKLEHKLTDFKTIEHVLIDESNQAHIYRIQQIGGDSIIHLSENPVEKEYNALFNEAFSASAEARTSITRIIIECITK